MSTEKPSTSELTDRRAEQRRYLGIVLAVYWLTLFLATHLPLPELPGKAPGGDKLVHLVGYCGLALLLTFWVALRSRLRLPVLLLLLGIVVVYAATDEWLQQFVNRTTDLGDWIADVCGGTLGIGIVWHLQRARPVDLHEDSEVSP